MKKNRQLEQQILQQIKELEALHPQLVAIGESPGHYAYKRSIARIKPIAWILFAIGLSIFIGVAVFAPEMDLRTYPGMVYLFTAFGCAAVGWFTPVIIDMGKYSYVVATHGTSRQLERIITRQKAELEEFAQRQLDAEIYHPKFTRLTTIIIDELQGSYQPYWDKKQPFWVWIGFKGSEAERYEINSQGYAKLLVRIMEQRCLQGDEELRLRIIQNCESSLKI